MVREIKNIEKDSGDDNHGPEISMDFSCKSCQPYRKID